MESKVLKIKCFDVNCERTFDDLDVKEILKGMGKEGDLLIVKYLKFKQMKLVDSDPLVKWCPR